MLQKKENLKKNIIISHNRILEVEKIEEKEIREGGKVSENENYLILDKDYGKSEELMRALLEKKKKLPFWLFILMIVFGGIMSLVIIIMTYKVAILYISPPPVVPVENSSPLIQKEIKSPLIVQQKEEIVVIQNNEEFIKIKYDYEALQLVYNDLLNNPNIIEKIEYEELIVLRNLNEKEKFTMSLGKSILNKCDKLLINNIDDEKTITCKNLYAKYILSIN